MSQKQDNLIVVLDIGSASTRVLVGDVNEQVLRYRGHGVAESAGMRKGLIAELGLRPRQCGGRANRRSVSRASTSRAAWWAWVGRIFAA